MTSIPIRMTFLAIALSFAAAASGEPGDRYGAASIIWNDDDAARHINDSVSGVQIEFGQDWTEHLSIEGLLGYSNIDGWVGPSVTVPGERHIELGVNLLAFYDRDATFAPYVLAGVGYLDNKIDDGSDLGLSFKPGPSAGSATATLGLGFKWKMGQSRYAILGQYRARTAFDTVTLTDRIAAIGLQYSFGGRKSEPVVPIIIADTDGDGDRDSDGDGDRVFDSVDACPGTPTGVPVDQHGCSLDSDMDGVTTDDDRCPGTGAGVEVDIYGCDNDVDGDGVPNHLDRCPETRIGARVDVNGCEIKDVISLPGVNFETGSDILKAGNANVLESAAGILLRYPDMQIEVAGHTDDVGSEANNLGLSERRARTVHNVLIRRGVAEDRLTFKGYGETQPIADNTSADGRATNRRVELRLVNREE